MLEKYNPDAKRVIFFARYEASRAGATSIEVEHLVLGIGRVDKRLARRLPNLQRAPEQPWWRRLFSSGSSTPRASTSDPIPFSGDSKRALASVVPDLEDRITPETLVQAILDARRGD